MATESYQFKHLKTSCLLIIFTSILCLNQNIKANAAAGVTQDANAIAANIELPYMMMALNANQAPLRYSKQERTLIIAWITNPESQLKKTLLIKSIEWKYT